MKYQYENLPRPVNLHGLLGNVFWEMVGQRIVNPGVTVWIDQAIRYEQPGDHLRFVIPISLSCSVEETSEYAGVLDDVLNQLEPHVDYRALIEDSSHLHLIAVAKPIDVKADSAILGL